MRIRSEEIRALRDEINEQAQKHAMEYAENEDRIRELWTAIGKESEAIMNMVRKQDAEKTEGEKERETESVVELANVKRACEAYDRIVATIDPMEGD
ncbi:hypothetical protein EW146_g5415 [Bondarzewia mesenterica]|uniref:Uncharacterized protein n=1 Tax=Bondarzewia mesenterica TaxID=1095465 RepID=A0A4S4LRJ6_9AGAM|nr:hypothetical protein EW146_g5415 [Bondarzewia mesenterica]